MNKAEIVQEIMELRTDIAFERGVPPQAKRTISNRLDAIIIDIMDDVREGELQEAQVGCICQDCEVIDEYLEKMDRLIESFESAANIAKEAKTPFKFVHIEPDNEMIERMTRGVRKTIEKGYQTYGIPKKYINPEDCDKMSRGGTDD